MYIKEISLYNFRNYTEQNIKLSPNINLFYGDNAQGKTNILESIFLGAFGKSFRTNREKELIKFSEKESKINISYQKKDRNGTIKILLSNQKQIYVNDIKLKKLSQLLGNISVVLFQPEDINILKNGPSQRRRFLDMMIGQLRPNYVHCLNLYLRILEQRNQALKQIKYDGIGKEMLDIWDEKLVEYGEKIYKYRDEFIKKILLKINPIHKVITDNEEILEINYKSDCMDNKKYRINLKESRRLDIQKGYTIRGIHHDDFDITINGKQVNIYGSQGQHRTVILSLKLSELQVVYDEIGEYPILLLDDFMSELDANRRGKFLQNIKNTQVIITCTDKITLYDTNYFSYQIKKGEII